jgi:deazaflavin-dependent oxidoreductase (nitroreductase family)
MNPDTWWKRTIRKLAASRLASKILARILRSTDLWYMKISGSDQTLTQRLTGLEVVCVETIGARTHQIRPVMLAGVRQGQTWLLAASNFGSRSHPAWYYNLLRFPEVNVNFQGESQKYHARLAAGDERAQCWTKLVKAYRGFEAYSQRADNRVIPVFVLEPLNPN